MFLRLRYYFKTDRKTRVQDKQEYADQRKKLKKIRRHTGIPVRRDNVPI
jgi:hypothetical protein